MKTYTTILFDLDGTLTDPKVGITKSVQFALAKSGIDEPNLERLTPFIGPPLNDSFQRFYDFTPSEAQQAIEYYREYFTQKGMFENVPYAGIAALLQSLKQQSRRLIVATSKPTVFAQQILNHFLLAQFFEAVVGSNLDGTRVDKAEVIEYALSQMVGVPEENCVMVGDRVHDIVGANANGIDSVAVMYGYGSREEFAEATPTYIANSVNELATILGLSAGLRLH